MKEVLRKTIYADLEDNYEYLKDLFKNDTDVIFRRFYVGPWEAAIIYIEGLADKNLLNDFVMETLMIFGDRPHKIEEIKDTLLTVTDISEKNELDEAINALLSGDTILMFDGIEVAYIIATRAWPARGVSEPTSESVLRGPKEALVETMRFNTALVRRRLRDSRLKVESTKVGVRSKTDIAIMYIEDIVNQDVLTQVREKLDKIQIDAILDSGYIEQLLEGSRWSIFPQVQSTERPDVVAAALLEGRVALIVDNTPFCVLVPTTLAALFQSPDDYNQRWLYASTIRLVRFIAILLSIILPAIYVSVTSFHTAILPTRLLYAIAASREGVPFPAFIETLIMEVSMALLVEAVLRLPSGLGSTIGIVGGLIIGQAAVTAGIVSPAMIIIVSLTSLTTFITPSYEVISSQRIIRLALIVAASIIGFYGIMLMLIVFLIHLIKLESFGVPYMAPAVNTRSSDLKDLFIRAPLQFFKKRPAYINPQDKIRQK
ncbi:MAG: spore germination protein [Clostridiales bacterium]|nr:spore germination protein [Clostridiales bacterium]